MRAVDRPLRILSIQNDVDKSGGRVTKGMVDAGAEIVTAFPFEALPPVEGFDGLMVLPGLDDPIDDKPAVHAARDAIVAARDLGIPVLGVCLGGQLLAQTEGAEIYRSTPELGLHPVRTAPAAQDDALMHGFPAEYVSFHAHAFAFRPAPGAEVLIESDACCQAMRIGDRAWALQLHPEMTVDAYLALADALEYDYSGGIGEDTARFFRDAGVDAADLRRRGVELDEVHTFIGESLGGRFVGVCRDLRD